MKRPSLESTLLSCLRIQRGPAPFFILAAAALSAFAVPPFARGQDLIATARAAHLAMARLDFAAAERELADFEKRAPDEKKQAAFLGEELKLTREAWTVLAARLDEAVREHRALSLAFAPGPGEASGLTGSFELLGVAGDVLRFQPAETKSIKRRSLFSLSPECLVALGSGAGAGGGTSPPGARFKEGLGLLLLLRRGQEAAKPLLLDPAIPEKHRKLNERRLEVLADAWLPAGVEAAEKLAAEYGGASPPAPADAWEFLAREAAELISRGRLQSGYEDAGPKLRRIYLDARERELGDISPEMFFHAGKVKLEKDTLELAYGFSRAEELEDFLPVKDGKREWVESEKALKVSGELRLCRGNPFQGSISVAGTASGFDPAAPNINLAFWTLPEDAVTVRPEDIDPGKWRPGAPREEARDDYLVVGMGYAHKVDLDRLKGTSSEQLIGVIKGLLPAYLREPTLVVLGGPHGKGLHGGPWERIWDAPAGKQLAAKQVPFSVSLDERRGLRWSLNQRTLPVPGAGLKRLRSPTPRIGSVTFFANGGTFILQDLKVTGRLNPRWLQGGARALAEADLAALEKKE